MFAHDHTQFYSMEQLNKLVSSFVAKNKGMEAMERLLGRLPWLWLEDRLHWLRLVEQFLWLRLVDLLY